LPFRVERLDALTGGEIIDLDTAIGHGGEALGKALRAGTETGKVTRPGAYHGDFNTIGGDGRCCDCGCSGCEGGGDATF